MKKLTVLWALAVIFAYSPAFAAEGAKPAKAENKGQEQKKEAKPAVKAKASKAVLRKIAKDEIGKEAVCPVSGEKFKVTEETISASYKERS